MRPLLQPFVPADAVVCDVGAHAGQFARLFAAMAPRGHVYAFEPGAYARSVLEPALRLRRVANVTVVPCGLADEEGSLELQVPVKRSGSLGFGLAHLGQPDGRHPVQREAIALTTLDLFAHDRGLERLDFIKADIEGWEIRMLDGASETLARFRPALLLELVAGSLERADDSPEDAWDILRPLGYRSRPLSPRLDAAAPGFAGNGDYLFWCEGGGDDGSG